MKLLKEALFLFIVYMASVFFGLKVIWAGEQLNLKPGAPKIIQGQQVKQMTKPDQAKHLKWQKVLVGQESIDAVQLLNLPNSSIWKRMGLRSGDVIVRINGEEVSNQDEMSKTLQTVQKKQNDQLNLEIIRQNNVLMMNYQLRW